ncbi:TrmH family RNA methyltransferase [Marinilabilia rubra]|uniref:tRNA (guanosine(18)-2'-O)-methyltransferase n=1 Tax=Marinilabilia rubra TaxID=2162893 RepID=A0A2U2BC44_9BACT|nr:RNA methyltransferase [Marinilabilia rubra]PWE00639.1 TrmH family RNA methyltransferase [Marinilabilia rubra]
MSKALIEYLSQFLTRQKRDLFNRVLSQRTNYITVVLEDIFHSHNASAVLRSCDCFGIQDVHLVENRHEYDVNPDIALGSSKWLTLHKYNEPGGGSTESALKTLKEKNYRILATLPGEDAVSFEEIDISKGPIALIFGGERSGVSEEVKSMADGFITIPMVGFTESLNISVAAAILLQHFSGQARIQVKGWELCEQYKDALLLRWIKQSVKRVDLIEKDFLRKYGNRQI